MAWQVLEQEQWSTPDPVGPMPATVKPYRMAGGSEPDDSRIEVRWTEEAEVSEDVVLIKDLNSGALMRMRYNQPCGLGCRCAATVELVR